MGISAEEYWWIRDTPTCRSKPYGSPVGINEVVPNVPPVRSDTVVQGMLGLAEPSPGLDNVESRAQGVGAGRLLLGLPQLPGDPLLEVTTVGLADLQVAADWESRPCFSLVVLE